MANNDTGRLLLYVAGAYLGYQALSGRAGGSPGDGGGGGGPANVQASLGMVTVSNHLVAKVPGDTIRTSVAVINNTRDAQGSLISWPMQLVGRLGHNTAFGWRQPTDLGLGTVGHRAIRLEHVGDQPISWLINTPADVGQAWDVRVWLYAMPSDENGRPVGRDTDFIPVTQTIDAGVSNVRIGQTDWQGIAYAQHPGAVQVVSGVAAVSGNLGSVVVEQPCPCAQQQQIGGRNGDTGLPFPWELTQ